MNAIGSFLLDLFLNGIVVVNLAFVAAAVLSVLVGLFKDSR